MTGDNKYWIGLVNEPPYGDNLEQRREGWTWLDGTPYTWANWLHTDLVEPQPTGISGVVTMQYNGDWVNTDENSTSRYICEKGGNYQIFPVLSIHLVLCITVYPLSTVYSLISVYPFSTLHYCISIL